MSEGQKKKARKKGFTDYEETGLNDRVFVCLGRLKASGAQTAWVMTLSKTYDEVTFWDVTQSAKYVLVGRVNEDEELNLQGYLSPALSDAEKKQVEKLRELQRQESHAWQSELDKAGGKAGGDELKFSE